MQQNKNSNKQRYKAEGDVVAPRAAPRKTARKRKRATAVLALVLAGMVLAGMAVALFVSEQRAGAILPPAAVLWQSPPALTPAMAQPPVAETAPPPVASIPQLEAPEEGWGEYAFSEEEVQRLNTLLDEWAAKAQPAEPQEAQAATGGASSSDPPAEGEETGHRVAVYFKDLDSGAEYVYNGEEKFDVASLSKAPYAMYLYQLVEQGQASLEETFLIDAESIKGSEENSGKLKDDPNLPRELSLAEMIEYLLRYSDTVAQRVLLKRYPAEGYAAWAAQLGLQYPADVRGVTSGVITAPDAGVYLAALQAYMASGQYGPQLQEHLMNTRNAMIRTPWPVARKYGWDTSAYHDMAVVYAPHPYLIAILTDKSGAAAEDLAQFTAIPALFEQMMARHWAEADLGPNTKTAAE